MKESNVGDVLVLDDSKLHGIVTDRDLVIRCMAVERDRNSALGEISAAASNQ